MRKFRGRHAPARTAPYQPILVRTVNRLLRRIMPHPGIKLPTRRASQEWLAPEPTIRGFGFITETRGGSRRSKMSRTILALAAASTLTVSMALAQAPGNPPASPSPPAMSQDSGKSDKAGPPSGASRLIAAQMADEWLASKFKGTDVIGLDGTKIGSVDDLLFDRSGTIKAIVVGVGGFLGIGAKDVALGFKEFQVVSGKDGNADQLKLGMTKEELTAAAEFKPYEPPRPTVSTAPGSSGMTRTIAHGALATVTRGYRSTVPNIGIGCAGHGWRATMRLRYPTSSGNGFPRVSGSSGATISPRM